MQLYMYSDKLKAIYCSAAPAHSGHILGYRFCCGSISAVTPKCQHSSYQVLTLASTYLETTFVSHLQMYNSLIPTCRSQCPTAVMLLLYPTSLCTCSLQYERPSKQVETVQHCSWVIAEPVLCHSFSDVASISAGKSHDVQQRISQLMYRVEANSSPYMSESCRSAWR